MLAASRRTTEQRLGRASLGSRRGRGVGSVWFSTEEMHSTAYDEVGVRARTSSAEDRDDIHLGFNDILRAEEVWELVAQWRARSLGSSPPSDIVEAPVSRTTLADKIQKAVIFVVLAVFCALFAIVSLQSDDNGARMWYVWVSIPYGLIWGTCGLLYLYDRYREYKRSAGGFVRLNQMSGAGADFAFAAGAASSSGSEVELIAAGVGPNFPALARSDDSSESVDLLA